MSSTILVVDDVPEIRDATASVLEDAGHTVLSCGGSEEALAVLRDGQAIDLLLTEVMMPGAIDGFELAGRARVARPAIAIAYLTGCAGLPRGGATLFGPIWRKPCRPLDLVHQVRELLAAGEDARLVRAVATEMIQRYADALDRATEAEELDRDKGDEHSAEAWRDIAAAIRLLQQSRLN